MFRYPFRLQHIIKKSEKLSLPHHSKSIMPPLNSKKSDFIDVESKVFHASTSPPLEYIVITLFTTETSEAKSNSSATIWIPSITIAASEQALIEVENR